jgi:hypothetical protein
MKESSYHSEWQSKRINFILSKYPKDFFVGKKILELGSFNGYIGAYFQSIGADVYSLEGREENVNNIKRDYPELKVECTNLDTSEWKWGHYDIIINFGLYYHLEKFHREHLINCINNCDLMFFETVVYDSNKSEIYFRSEPNDKFADQSLSEIGGTPSTKFIEDIFDYKNTIYKKYTNSELNSQLHVYDWHDKGTDYYNQYYRRFWIIKND